ncbi:hypothetical protein T03_7184 [Trichinella britovi]|uniref:Uncharacterized protein n=1 Tax=Trichinella britovi TaxID=45882 RepID=A0A0V1CL36_TRIBR|nr:hypothetical protein T03_7184 [Trichinella britovi]
MTNGSMSSHWCVFPSTMMDSILRSVQINLFACPFPCECDLDRDVLLGLGHDTGFNVGERECGPPFVEIIRQDQDVLIPRRGPFQRSQDVHADLLQEVQLRQTQSRGSKSSPTAQFKDSAGKNRGFFWRPTRIIRQGGA